ncbi:unnamed protein product [Sphagnum jensenii]|uniref:Peptidase C14 caspase domain-containing protein n=1 Tax=Sphagnum jensenii TaxID=128206 RepID=A0ABP1A696_9BRYO
MARKRAVLAGCNYPGTKCELHGCANDVIRMKKTLLERFGFHEADILLLLDSDPKLPQPTGANIRQSLAKLIEDVQPDDVLVFHYSGHGTQVPPESGVPDDTGMEEAIVPTDMNILTDDDFRDLVNKIPSGVTFTFISDSCHSGGLIDSEKEQIGGGHNNSTGQGHHAEGGLMGLISRGLQAFHIPGDDEAPLETQPQTQTIEFESQYAADVAASQEDAPQSRNKNLDINTLTEILSQRTGQDVKVGNIRTTLFDVFGDQASSSVKTFVNAIFSHLQGGHGVGEDHGAGWMAMVSSVAGQFLKTKLDTDPNAMGYMAPALQGVNPFSAHTAYSGLKPPAAQRVRADCGILLSGCQSNETSADATVGGDKSKSYGAFSNAIQTVLSQTNGPITNRNLVLEARKVLAKSGFKQHPCLFSADTNVDAHFLCPV